MIFWWNKPPPPPAVPEGVYRGRLVCDGTGHLLAFEGEWAGHPVYHDSGSNTYLFVAPGGASHNDLHSTRFAPIETTVEGDPHHFAPTEDDPHYHQNAPGSTRLLHDPDAVAPCVTGHTEAYT